jgi:phosphoribosyl 1,2-cyclic phosphodiesterase
VRDLGNVLFHDVPPGEFDIGQIHVHADLVSHPGATLGYRLVDSNSTLAYLPDHEPALGNRHFPGEPEWTSGFSIAAGVDVLVHDAQYTDHEYEQRVGWGHTSTAQLARFAEMTGVKRLVTFHHDPAHDDSELDRQHADLESVIEGVDVIRGTTDLAVDL